MSPPTKAQVSAVSAAAPPPDLATAARAASEGQRQAATLFALRTKHPDLQGVRWAETAAGYVLLVETSGAAPFAEWEGVPVYYRRPSPLTGAPEPPEGSANGL